jgi:hypothetical protein
MKRILKSNPEYPRLVASSPIHFSVKDYGFFLTPEEWRNVPIINEQPSTQEGQFLNLVMVDVDGQLRREWVVVEVFEEVTEGL